MSARRDIPTDKLIRIGLRRAGIPGVSYLGLPYLDTDELIFAMATRLQELTKVQDPCPECGENMIPLQKGSTKWSCKNHHTVERT